MSIQLLIILVYFALTIFIGFIAKRKSVSASSFHGANLGVLMCVAAGTGEWLGGTSTTGVAEYGFIYGLSGAWYTIANGIGVIVLAIFFAKLYRSLETVTVPGIIEKFIGVDARVVSSVLLTLVMIAVGTSQVIAAGALGVGVLGIPFDVAVIVLGIGFIIYTLAGGMVSVGYTNTMHLFVMYGGVILALVFSIKLIGGSDVLLKSLPQSYFSFSVIGSSKISSWLIASILGACTAQAGIQPILAAKDVHVARKAAFITAFVVAPFGILTSLLGVVSKIALPGLDNAKEALPLLMMQLDPLVGGIVLAAIFAAILSTVSPIILASGTMITKDIYQRKLHPGASDRQIFKVSRIFTGISGIVCIVLALIFYGETKILDMVYSAYSLRGAIFVVLLFAIYWKRTSAKGATLALLFTGITVIFWVAYKAVFGTFPISAAVTETYAAIIAATFSTVLFSLMFKKDSLKQRTENIEDKYVS